MINKPLVSIITPCYNSEAYLNRYFDSILNQTYDNIELVIVNDGSNDKTEEVVFSYKEKINQRGYKLKYLKQENQGIGGAINNGLKLLTGEYFTWCDSDNFYSSDYIQEKVDCFSKNPECSIVRCDGYIVDESNITSPLRKMARDKVKNQEKNLFENCLTEKGFHFGCSMIKTADFDKINPKREIYPSREGQNWQLLLPMFYHYKTKYIDKAMFYFVFRQNSVSNITQILPVERLMVQKDEYERILINTIVAMNIPEEEKWLKVIKSKYARMKFSIFFRRNMVNEMKEEYVKLKKLGSVNFKYWLLYRAGKIKIIRTLLNKIRRT